MNTVWRYLTGGKNDTAAQSSGDDNDNVAIGNALQLLVAETAALAPSSSAANGSVGAVTNKPTSAAASAIAIRHGRTYLRSSAVVTAAPPAAEFSSASPSSTHKCVATLNGHEDRIWGLAWHPSGDLLVSCGGDRTARLWIRRHHHCAGGNSTSSAAADDEYPFSWECIHTIRNEHAGTIRAASWSADGTRLALCSFDGTISIWIVLLKNGKKNSNGDGDAADETDDAADDEEDAADGGDDNTKTTADFHIELEITLDGHESEVKGVAWFNDTYNYNYVNDAAVKKAALSICGEEEGGASTSSQQLKNIVEKSAHLLLKTNAIGHGGGGATKASAASPSSSLSIAARRPLQIATCSRDRSVWVWEGKQTATTAAPAADNAEEAKDPITALIANTMNSTTSAAALSSSSLTLLPTATAKAHVEYECAGVLTGHPQDVKSVAWVPSAVLLGEDASSSSALLPPAGVIASGTLLSCSYDDTARCWEEHKVRKDDWDCSQTLAGHDGTVWEAAVQPNAEVVETIQFGKNNASNNTNDATNTAAFTWRHALPTNNIVVTAADDGRLIAWQKKQAQAGGNEKENFVQVGSVGGFADGRTVYSVSFAPATLVSDSCGCGGENNSIASATTTTSDDGASSSSYALAVSDIVAAGTGDDSVVIFRLAKKTQTQADGDNATTPSNSSVPTISFEPHISIANAHDGEVNCVRFNPCATASTLFSDAVSSSILRRNYVELATASDDGQVKVWTVAV